MEVDAAAEEVADILREDAEDDEEEAGAWEVEHADLPGEEAGSQAQPAQSSSAAAPRQPSCKMERLMASKLIYGRGPPRKTQASGAESPAALAAGPSSVAESSADAAASS